MTFGELLKLCPECGESLFKYGLHCIGCHLSTMESLEEGCRGHGIPESEMNQMIKELNEKIKGK